MNKQNSNVVITCQDMKTKNQLHFYCKNQEDVDKVTKLASKENYKVIAKQGFNTNFAIK